MGLNKRKNHFTLLLNIYTEACCIKRFFFHGKKAHRPNSWYVHKSWRKQNGERSGCWFLGPWHKGITYSIFIVQYSLRAANTVIRHFSTSFPLICQRMYRGRILGRNPDKRLAIHSHIYSFALRFLFLQTYATFYSFYGSVTAHCKGVSIGKADRKPNLFPMV